MINAFQKFLLVLGFLLFVCLEQAQAANTATNPGLPTVAGSSMLANQTASSGKPSELAIAASRLPCRKAAGATTACTAAEVLEFIGTTQGQVLYRDGSAWVTLAAGASGQFLKTGGAAANPSWGSVITNGTVQNSTSGSAVSFTSVIPANVKHIVMTLNGVSISGTDDFIVQLGTGGSYTSSGYDSESASIGNGGTQMATSATGCIMNEQGATTTASGTFDFWLQDAANDIWVGSSHYGDAAGLVVQMSGCVIDMAGTVDSIRLDTTGSNTFDAGKVNIHYEVAP